MLTISKTQNTKLDGHFALQIGYKIYFTGLFVSVWGMRSTGFVTMLAI